MWRKLCIVAAALLLLCLACGSASASGGSCGSSVYWNLSSDGKTLTISGTGAMADYEFEEEQPWYESRGTITKLTIGNGITALGGKAFFRLTGLTGISIPDSVTVIGEDTFCGCTGLTRVTIPGNVKTIRHGAFYNCSGLASLTLSNGIKEIEELAFSYCPLTGVTIPKSVEVIDGKAFYRCEKLVSFSVNSASSNYAAVDGVIYNKAKTELCVFPSGKTGTFTVPDHVTRIGDYAFSSTALSGVTVPGSVKDIGQNAFSSSSGLATVQIQPGIETIRIGTFEHCSALTGLKIPDGVKTIEMSAFSYSSIQSVSIPDSVTEIGSRAFYNCSKLESVTLPENLQTIPSSCFGYCTGLTGVTIPGGVTEIEWYAFQHCEKLSRVAIPSSVTAIGAYAFEGCKSLTYITLPPGVAEIGSGAFSGCTSLANVDILNENAVINSPFNTSLMLSGYSGSTAETYAAGEDNITFRAIQDGGVLGDRVTWIMIDGAMTVLGEGDMYNYENENSPLKEVRDSIDSLWIANGITSIGKYVFQGCACLQEVTVPGSVRRIGEGAFCWCAISRLEISRGVESIGVGAFSGCTSLRSVTIPETVSSLWNGCFAECEILYSAIIPPTVTTVGTMAFDGCDEDLAIFACRGSRAHTYAVENGIYWVDTDEIDEDFILPKDLITIQAQAFMGINARCITIPNGAKSIGSKAFANCAELLQIHIPESVTSIAADAFDGLRKNGFIIIGDPGSYAETYAAANGYVFIPESNG